MVTGHKKEFQEAINLLKTRGFVVSVNGLNYEQSVLYQYNFDNLRFEKSSKTQLMDLWNKIYINLGPYLVDYENADYFKLYISSWYNRNDGPQYFYYDNLKIIYRDR